MKQLKISAVVAAVLCSAAGAWQNVTWDFYYYGQYLPGTNNVISTSSSDTSKWSEYITGSAARTSLVYDNTLGRYVVRINTLGTNSGAAWSSLCDIGDRNGDGIFPQVWYKSTGYTFEVKAKLNSTDLPGTGAASFEISERDGTDHCYVSLQTANDGKQYVSLSGYSPAGAKEISAGWHIYRITVSSDGARLYIDGSEAIVQYLSTSSMSVASHPYLVFGDTTNEQDASFDVAYIAVYADAAVPAPAPIGSYVRPTCGAGVVSMPTTCDELIGLGHGLAGDLNRDCHVNFSDLAMMVKDWARCIEPANVLCTQSEQIVIADMEVHYVKEPNGYTPRQPPYPSNAFPSMPPLPPTIEVPYAWDTENLFSTNRPGFVLQESERPWILHLAYSTKYDDDTTEGSMDYKVWYRVSNNGGMTWEPLRQVILCNAAYDYNHPIDNVFVGKNGFCFTGIAPLVRASNGELLVPFSYWPLDANGVPYHPYPTTSFDYAAVLIGRWTADGNDIVWTQGEPVEIDAEISTRGTEEPTIAELNRKGEFMMIIRCSNEASPSKLNYRYVSYSRDYCRTWSKPEPMTYTDGTKFFSPASSSTIIRSIKNGRLYWIGNVLSNNPNGNLPRYPLIIGEVDEVRGLIQSSVVTIDTRNPTYDSQDIQLSNFHTYQDTATGNILIVLNRIDYWWEGYTVWPENWYLIQVPEF